MKSQRHEIRTKSAGTTLAAVLALGAMLAGGDARANPSM